MTSSKRLCLALLFAGLFLAPAFAQQEDYEDSLPTPVYVPSPQEVVDEMLKFAKVTKDDVVFDLGCGDGRIVISAAKLGARGVGVDINPERIKESNENAEAAGVTGRVKFINGDLFKADISPATVVTLYLLPARLARLRPKLWQELKVGTRIVAHDFDLDDWKPEETLELEGHRLFLWTVKEAQKRGEYEKEQH
ncbi:MAG: methyltransferase domain-containing protein [Bryobacterales bacterium]|nr:methyltransferase domain-containing protein [Bryobacterales bacterium]